MARFFRSVSMLISDDLPTFERPMKAYSGRSPFGHWLTLCEEEMKDAFLIFMVVKIAKVGKREGENDGREEGGKGGKVK